MTRAQIYRDAGARSFFNFRDELLGDLQCDLITQRAFVYGFWWFFCTSVSVVLFDNIILVISPALMLIFLIYYV